jgi:toxin ParE1/3/4
MTYAVRLTDRAQRDLAHLFESINAEYSVAATEWYIGFTGAILSLELQPHRCPVTPENHKLRHLLYGKKPHIYRAIYQISEKQKQVTVLHIRHGARQKFNPTEFA